MQATIQFINKELSGYYPESEIQSFARIIIEHVCRIDYTTFVVKQNEKLNSTVKKQVETIVSRLKKSEPLQYILGETEFFGMKIKVTPAVLIPRQETEELVQWIIENNLLKTLSVLDIGTGSGCIAMAIKKYLFESNVTAIDFSQEALQIAEKNAGRHELNINFIYSNILCFENYNWGKYDLVVSNPPYVRELEKQQMEQNVLRYEPEGALFVPDEDPLVFYRRIAEFCKMYLIKDGLLYVEINENFGEQLKELFHKFGFINLQLKKDIRGKDRFIKCTKQ